MYPMPDRFGKQSTDCGGSHFGSQRTTSGNSTVNAMVMKNTMWTGNDRNIARWNGAPTNLERVEG
jgi:hypothetical protein